MTRRRGGPRRRHPDSYRPVGPGTAKRRRDAPDLLPPHLLSLPLPRHVVVQRQRQRAAARRAYAVAKLLPPQVTRTQVSLARRRFQAITPSMRDPRKDAYAVLPDRETARQRLARYICEARKARREVLHAFRLKRGRGARNRTWRSEVRC